MLDMLTGLWYLKVTYNNRIHINTYKSVPQLDSGWLIRIKVRGTKAVEYRDTEELMYPRSCDLLEFSSKNRNITIGCQLLS